MSYMMTSESDDGMDSSTYNEPPAAGRSRGKGSALKKGPWTSAEDRILIGYVQKHGEGNWNAVQRYTSLSRCGKSCRLRWANHLRPNLKKGAFSPEEEQLIVEMHAKIGNKWAKMADHLPGRTDNEIKNYWNTRIKRRQRAGLPLYPPDILVEDEDLLWSEEYTKSSILRVNRRRHHDFSQLGHSKADVLYENLNFASSLLPGASDLSDMVVCNMLETGACTPLYESYMPPILPSPKPLQECGSQFPMCSSNIKIEFQSPEQFQNTASPKNSKSCSISPCDVDHPPYGNQYSSDMMIPESHTFTDGMLPTSKPSFGAVKLELPSFQYSETGAFEQWKTPTSSPQSDLLDSVDTYIQSPPPSEIEESDCFSSCDTGLLDMLLYEAKIKNCAKHSSFLSSSDQSFSSTTCRTGVTENVPRACDTQIESGDFEDSQKNLARSKIPVPMQLNAGNVVVKTEESDQVWEPKRVDITRPDVLLASSWLDHGCFGFVRDSSSMTDALALLLGGDDIGNSYMTVGSSSSQAPQGVGSCTWTNMSPVWSL